MRRIKTIIAVLLALTMTACSETNTAEVITTSAETTESITTVREETILSVSETTETADETTSETAAETQSKQELAKIYAAAIMDRMDSMGDNCWVSPTVIGNEDLHSILYLADIDFDGTPELFAGSMGNNGIGSYDVFLPDGSLMGTLENVYSLSYGSAVDGAIYIDGELGTTKIVPNFPSVNNYDRTDYGPDNLVKVINADGTEYDVTVLTFEDLKKLVSDVFDVDYDALINPENLSNYICIAGFLEVSDTENYTKEDISDCIEKLIEKYNIESGLT